MQAVVHDDFIETIGINTRVHLSEAEAAMRVRINREHMLNGVSMMNPAETYIEVGVKIGRDTLIMPNTYLTGNTEIGEGNVIGPNAIIRDTKIGNRCRILASVMEGAVLEDDVDMGPFARLRKGAHLKRSRPHGQLWGSEGFHAARRRKDGTLLLYRECKYWRQYQHRRRDDHL